jgi:hypothetical protein
MSLKLGNIGVSVSILEHNLAALGLYSGEFEAPPSRAKFGPGCLAGVRAYQGRLGLTITGEADAELLERLDADARAALVAAATQPAPPGPTFVPDQKTLLTLDEVILAFLTADRKVLGSTPPTVCLACQVAHSALETGHWKSMHNFDFGNEKMSSSWKGLYTQFKCDELFDPATAQRAKALGPCVLDPLEDGTGRVRVVLIPPHPWSSFVAFDNAAEGAADQVDLICCRLDRYATAWSACYRGDPEAFVRALGAAHYFTGNIEPYVKAVVSIFHQILPACQAAVDDGDSPLDDETRARVAGLVAATIWDSALGRIGRAESAVA